MDRWDGPSIARAAIFFIKVDRHIARCLAGEKGLAAFARPCDGKYVRDAPVKERGFSVFAYPGDENANAALHDGCVFARCRCAQCIAFYGDVLFCRGGHWDG